MLTRRTHLGCASLVFAFLAAGCASADDSDGPNAAAQQDTNKALPAVLPDEDPQEATAACPSGNPTRAASSSLTFDGVDDHVTMGTAPALGLDKFTIETWVKRTGEGVAMGTGVGGVSIVPIMGKGRGENDGSTVDCNYALGFWGDVIGADFEDSATGANHPVTGKTPIPMNEWHHVAATYDGAKWSLYVDGKLDAEAVANATPRKDSIQHFGLGSALDSTGKPAGFLKGALDEARVWNRARSAAEIAQSVYKRITAPEAGLIGRWALDTGAPAGSVPDSIGQLNGKLVGNPAFAVGGAILDSGLPPKISSESPALNAEVTGASTELSVKLEDVDSTAFTATFHVRPIGDSDDFTIVVLPDTQYYTARAGLDRFFYDQTKWIVNNAEAYNIVGAIHNGDIVDNGTLDAQWAVANKAMKILDDARSPRFPQGVPYGQCAGNHDQRGGLGKYNTHFGPQRFTGKKFFGGTFAANKSDENWVQFDAGGLKFIVVDLQYAEGAREAPVLSWTRSIFEQHPDAFGVVNSHRIVDTAGRFSGPGQSIYDSVKDLDNVQLLTNGHFSGEARRTDTFQGHAVHSMLADYQGRTNGGDGWFRIWEFSPKSDELTVRTFSPTQNKFETDADSEFTLKVDLAGAAKGTFTDLSTVDPASATNVKATLGNLAPGQTYEWYVTVTDCSHKVSSPRYRFRTK